tara:strand:+ start:29144 stop:29362 length:219 start_codon:yes stop_codon:yes gene_type:complete
MARYRHLTDGEMKEPEWWCNHHKESIIWLVTRINGYFTKDGAEKEQMYNIIQASLPAFAKAVGVDLDEVKES